MISLTASQKSLSKLFTQREQYIIPDFQRPYSWGIDQCRKLYDDLVDAYNSDKDYFLGNIIMAVGEKQESQPNVVDGQQRLISLWLMFRSLSLIFPEMKVLEETLSTSNWDGSTKEIKIQSNVIETYDWKELEKVSKWTVTDIENELNTYTDKNGDFYYPSRMNKIEANCLSASVMIPIVPLTRSSCLTISVKTPKKSVPAETKSLIQSLEITSLDSI